MLASGPSFGRRRLPTPAGKATPPAAEATEAQLDAVWPKRRRSHMGSHHSWRQQAAVMSWGLERQAGGLGFATLNASVGYLERARQHKSLVFLRKIWTLPPRLSAWTSRSAAGSRTMPRGARASNHRRHSRQRPNPPGPTHRGPTPRGPPPRPPSTTQPHAAQPPRPPSAAHHPPRPPSESLPRLPPKA